MDRTRKERMTRDSKQTVAAGIALALPAATLGLLMLYPPPASGRRIMRLVIMRWVRG
jgi:hypothetical protein